MGDFVQVLFEPVTGEQAELLMAMLTEEGYEGFEEGEGWLKAYVPDREFNEGILADISSQLNVACTQSLVQETNWNEVWESNFQPVVVEHADTREPWVGIRAHFHPPFSGVAHEIIITPKMSFGTGHHATTYMMVEQMAHIDFTGKRVFDFGTGTGVLSILAEKLGAADILAVDNDDWSIANTEENLLHNGCTRVQPLLADRVPDAEPFDIILANINKNVILAHMPDLVVRLKRGGQILFSGLLVEDEEDIRGAAGENSLHFLHTTVRNNWICIGFSR
ncbi:MAG: 50S ribosomal protein L11 methyltransferase [Bacteroidetes bacterium]|nr:50S ribosomal protein L11 methyltransferase [Bacteroidota bacterium]